MIYCLSDFVTLVILLKLNARFLSHSTKKIYYPRSRESRGPSGDQEDALSHFSSGLWRRPLVKLSVWLLFLLDQSRPSFQVPAESKASLGIPGIKWASIQWYTDAIMFWTIRTWLIGVITIKWISSDYNGFILTHYSHFIAYRLVIKCVSHQI